MPWSMRAARSRRACVPWYCVHVYFLVLPHGHGVRPAPPMGVDGVLEFHCAVCTHQFLTQLPIQYSLYLLCQSDALCICLRDC
jgi:hypothetical protein